MPLDVVARARAEMLALPAAGDREASSTSSSRFLRRSPQDEADRVGQPLPARRLRLELRPPLACQAVELRLATGLGVLPLRLQEAAVLQPMQRRVERALLDLSTTPREICCEPLSDRVPVEWA